MIKEITLPKKPFHPFPVYGERAAWTSLPESTKSFYLAEAAKKKNNQWPSLPATVYLEFYRDGNRNHYEKVYFGRRSDLQLLTIAECIEGRGEYIDDIINGIWLICEETTWVIPAHLNHGHPSKGSFYHRGEANEKISYPQPRRLHDPEDEVYIDLFAAETGSLISWVYYLLGDAISERAPEVKRRMELEVARRILNPFLEYDYYPWMGLAHENPVNNWNPWINSNILIAYLVFAGIYGAAEKGVNKTIKSTNRFLHFYADDGGCDEGPSYFRVAGASLLDFIEELETISDVSYLYKTSKIRNIFSYIYKVYIGNCFYVNYADAAPRVFAHAGALGRAGVKTGNETLSAFTSFLREKNWWSNDAIAENTHCLFRLLSGIFDKPAPKQVSLNIPTLAWFPGIQVVTARDSGSLDGFFFSAKGGTNAESHNHNDVGSFLLYCDSVPVVVDAGVETYTKFTFSDKRYGLWTMQSGFHNLPTINGSDQGPGREFCASDVSLSGGNDGTCPASGIKFCLDIAKAYPQSADVKSYKREFVFVPGSHLEISDSYELGGCKSPLIMNLLLYEKPQISGGKAELGGKAILEFDSGIFTAGVEEIKLIDPKIHEDWKKDFLYRLRLVKKDKDSKGSFKIKITRKK